MKILKWVILAVIIIIVVGLLALYFNLNRIIRTTVVSQSQKQLQVNTSLDSARLSIFNGTLSLNDFVLGSPKGFSSPQMFSLGQASVDVQYDQLTSNPIHIKEVSLVKPVLTIEQADGKLNFKALMDQLPPTDPNAKKSELNVIIDKMTIDSPQVLVKPGLPGMTKELSLSLPSITMNNIGSGQGNQNGAALKDVVMTVVNEMAADAAKSGHLPKELQALLSLNTKEISAQISNLANEQIQKATDQLNKKLGNQAGQAVNDALKGITGPNDNASKDNTGNAVENGLQNLLGGDKKKQPAGK